MSMVGNTTLLHIHQRLKEIFGTASSQLFMGISIIAVGDLCQLPPIHKMFVFDDYKYDCYIIRLSPMEIKIIELTKIMQQKKMTIRLLQLLTGLEQPRKLKTTLNESSCNQ